jgi:hypothetical protein
LGVLAFTIHQERMLIAHGTESIIKGFQLILHRIHFGT